MIPTAALSALSFAGALFCAAAYIYAYVLRSRGSRRFHVAGLLFTGLALASVPGAFSTIAAERASLHHLLIVGCLLISVACQAVTAFRGRRGERRGEQRAVSA